MYLGIKNHITAMHCIHKIDLDDASIIRRTPEVEHERAVAIFDILEGNSFRLLELPCEGPYALFISVTENRLGLHISSDSLTQPHKIILTLSPFRSVIKDYFMICESYFEAIKHATPQKIETIDMARRSTHNEGSELLKSLLKDKVELDFETARRLFTLVCVLHIK
jgi:uncharacterized protein (UPF0262 family)